MRGKLILFVLLLGIAGLVVGWRFAGESSLFDSRSIPASLRSFRELEDVPVHAGLTLPSEVRVALTNSPVSQVEFAVEGAYTASVDGVPSAVLRGNGMKSTLVTPLPNGFRVGHRQITGTTLDIVPERSPAVWVADHEYRGRLRLVRQRNNKIVVVNVVPLEDYIASVVDGEMPAAFPDAARQAQAIAARSYALFQLRSAGSSPLFDVFASTRSQNYGGYQYRGRDGRRYAAESESSRHAARQTAGVICLCEGQPFCTYYTAVCGGRTVGGAAVFNDESAALAPVECPWCHDAELYRWTQELPLDEAAGRLQRFLVSQGKPFGNLASIRHTNQTDAIREPAFEISDGSRRYRVSAFDLRRQLNPANVPSYQFEAKIAEGLLVLEGRGHGHGVGLCQWGARGLAEAGSGPLAILRHYYPGVEVVQLR
ncbi:MAG TPA: SpoIID/LytB domain-containing protein [Planctomycetaceae bacterium]|jgi:stage II sporulation protein D|nr:SpoIID/LytB domain-containing protein [Planctomycetaceae bacterium]